MTKSKVITGSELLGRLILDPLIWYFIYTIDDKDKENEYDFTHLYTEVRQFDFEIADYFTAKYVVDLSKMSKQEVTYLINEINNRATKQSKVHLEESLKSRLKEIDKIWSNK